MTDDDSRTPWLPAMFTEQMQEAGEQMMGSQQELLSQFMQASSANPMEALSSMGPINPGTATFKAGTATFKARVQSGGRISIPDAEREALDIEEGDIVQTIVVPVKRSRDES